MPGTLTHFWIFHQTVSLLPDREILAELRQSVAALTLAMSASPTGYSFDEYSKWGLLASYGWFGATGPDLFLIPDDSLDAFGTAVGGRIDGVLLSDLMHYNRASNFAIGMLRGIKEDLANGGSADYRERIKRKLAFAIGYITHVAADVIVHPLVNTRATAYPKNPDKQFESSEGSNWLNIFKLHHKIEHYQDSYTRARLFEGQLGFQSGEWEGLDFPRTACEHLASSNANLFIVDELETYYRYRDDTLYGWASADKEAGKLNFFTDTWITSISSFRNYYVNVIPSTDRMDGDVEAVVRPAIFEQYIKRAAELATAMIAEVASYLWDGIKYENKPLYPADRYEMYDEKRRTFKLLRKQWNLDCGIGYEFERQPQLARFKMQGATLHVPLSLHMQPPGGGYHIDSPPPSIPPKKGPPPQPKEKKPLPAAWLPTTDDKILMQEYLCGKRPGLKHTGYDLGSYGPDGDGVDGIVGEKTKAAVRSFQSDHGNLVVDGIYGPKTRAAFDEELNGL